MLQVALAPALVALGEVQQVVRTFLERSADRGIEANLVAGAGEQRRLDIVVAEDLPAEWRLAAQRRQAAALREGADTEDRVVAPIRSLAAQQHRGAVGVFW